jgi:hypothetical protein
MRAKYIYEQNIRDILRPKSEEEILAALPGHTDINFKLTDKFPEGTSFHNTTISTSYKNLVKLFGKPNSPGDEYKVSSKWILEDDNGHLVTIYDWKSTKLYDSDYPNVYQFRKLDSWEWHIGGSRIEDEENLQAFVYIQLTKMNK